MNVAVLGASNKAERHSNMAVKLLTEKGHAVFPVNPALQEIDGIKVFKRLADIHAPINTVTVYLGPARSAELEPELVGARPQRVIFNPGAENPALENKLRTAGIEAMNACTLVLLKTGGF